ncbi:MAG: mechanosensitive ion channel family protein [Methylophilaceae bacterium]
MQYQIDIFLTSLNEFWGQIATFFPKLLAVMVILFFGWICAKVACIGVKRILEFTQFDKFADKSGLEAFLQHSEFDLTLSGIIGQVIYWLVILLFVITGANTLGLNEVAGMLHQLANYLPKIIVAILVMIFGTLLARFVNRLVFAWLHGIKFEGALAISTSAEYGIQIFALFVALEQLDIGTQLLTALFVIIFGAIFLALAIAFGLGGKEWAARIIENIQANKKR